MQEWRRRVLHIVGLLLVTLAVCAIGLIALDSSGQPLPAKMFRGAVERTQPGHDAGRFDRPGRAREGLHDGDDDRLPRDRRLCRVRV